MTPRCPSCRTALSGGPVIFWCACGKQVTAADIEVEHTARVRLDVVAAPGQYRVPLDLVPGGPGGAA